MKENIKIALMALIAVTLIINTFMKGGSVESSGSGSGSVSNSSEMASSAASSNPSVTVQPGDNITPNPPIVNDRPKTMVTFESYDHDFGTIKQDTENEKIFKFTNTGKEPLFITDAKGSCGCTVPEYPREPIAPGKTGEIKVVYSPGKQQNQQTKSVTITANTEPPTTVLKIYANVTPGEGGAEAAAH